MSRSISTALLAEFQLPAPSVATCIRVTRTDGNVYAFTTIDTVLAFSGFTHIPIKNIRSTAMKENSDVSVGTVDFDGIISNDIITDNDLKAGLYRDADVLITAVDFTQMPANPSNPPLTGEVIKFRGTIGKVTVKDGVYQVEVNTLQNFLKKKQGLRVYMNCWTEFCSPECTLNEATYTYSDTILSVIDQLNFEVTGTYSAGAFRAGKAKITQNGTQFIRGIKEHVIAGGHSLITLRGGFPFAIANTNPVLLVQGCDKYFSTCKGYENAINFRGFPFVPTNQVLISMGHPPILNNGN